MRMQRPPGICRHCGESSEFTKVVGSGASTLTWLSEGQRGALGLQGCVRRGLGSHELCRVSYLVEYNLAISQWL